ncbi:MAG: cobalamin biosynthesis bifunctional protein CbiET [Hydrogenophilales bacterium CG03_land_8_20_14_0_80_62_28]|nr:MAG: cobalamin biosynthesis bifunctional protein CbiET [Hydrogenophilales bacterium CG03_land_8_20_14_0_80_62_28]PIW37682.1 MAG: cobalamin biosynthesis bifunctional protein CbiET [Hydrogenophilales bacterium CG15_BIG_FIL_POST_REV_8_21_14_020_62_31]PIX00829.1 MAG: cobalamin biosynthesis bifunctional protein CbiET [Hydrogenophilales bacterium CG_4_8_14_3_um_filter_62_83]PIY98955.1 MAG: cobalamin biosynthesis bifunctional protein CbiET [Hydrogenophilales bacterium CG_4_10_14_0_8_um_filter_62_70]
MTEPCTLVGILDDGWPSLTEAARAELAAAGLVIGVRRMLDRVAPHLPPGVELRAMDGLLSQVPDWVRQARADGLEVAILATGDPLCHGIGSLMIAKLGTDAVRVLPAPSTLQIACARLKRPWQEMKIVSVHGADAGEWREGATPGHGLYPLVRAVTEHDRVAAFTSPHNGPDRIARALLAAGFGDTLRISVAARLQLADEALFHDLPLEEAARSRFPDPNIVLIEWHGPRDNRALFGFEDGDYVQRQPDKGLITKLEARAVSLAKLGLRADSIVWDIGAGAGSVGLEAARIARHGHVFAMEKNAADAANCRENARRLRATNYTLIESRAPAGLDTWPDPDAVFIGGSGGELAGLITLSLSRLKPGGRLVMNFATLENLATATATLVKIGTTWEVVQLSAARSQPILDMHRLAALNPVWIVVGWARICAYAAVNEGVFRVGAKNVPTLPISSQKE